MSEQREGRKAEPDPAVAALLDHLSIPVLLADGRGRLVFANDAAAPLYPAWRDPPTPRPLQMLLARSRDADGPVSAHSVAPFGGGQRFDVTLAPLDKPAGWVLVQLVPLHADWETGEQLLHQHSAASALLRGLSHELRNPLAGIRGAAQLMARAEDPGQRREYQRIIKGECDRMTRLLSAMGRSQPLEPEPLNIHEVAERVLTLIDGEAAGRLVLERDYDPSLPLVTGDRDALVQALLNLARNALQAGAANITVRTRLVRDALVGATRHPRSVRVEILDDGPGIPDSLRPMLFFPTVSGRGRGSGMGLTIAQSIAIRHDGLLSFQSEPGRTVFMLHLPLTDKRA